jgi:signal peptidase II
MQAARGASLGDADPQPSLTSSPEPGPAGPDRSPAPARRRLGPLLTVAAVVLLLDQLSKLLVVRLLDPADPVSLLGGLLTLRLVRNPGAAFGLAAGATILFTAVAAVVVVVILRIARRLMSLPWAISLGLLLGGAVGNLGDRVFRGPAPLRGHVVDFIELPHYPVFNVADSAIVLAGVSMVIYTLRGMQVDGTTHRG